MSLNKTTLLVTFHPVTLDYKNTSTHIDSILCTLKQLKIQTVFTYPNSDTAGRIIIQKINEFVKQNKWSKVVKNFGQEGYFSMMKYASAMVGNSSSGIIESASFELPVLNIGDRQKGRVSSFNVINVDHDKTNIFRGIKKIITPSFKTTLKGMENPYGNGSASNKIVDTIANINLDNRLIMKKFRNTVDNKKH